MAEPKDLNEPKDLPKPKEWTLMFYFASDNPLAPGIVSQLKTIKNAGYHPEVNVIAYFDPQPAGTPAHIFDVNAINKLKDPEPKIGFNPKDPFVRNLMEDRLWGDELRRDEKTTIRDSIIERLKNKPKPLTYDRPKAPPPPAKKNAPPLIDGHAGAGQDKNLEAGHDKNSEPEPQECLRSFLNFCADKYKAEHYILFILGHGLVVGNDVFLFDEHASRQSVTLMDLDDVLTDFNSRISGSKLELISFHSCSMSSLEVAFQLKGKANYMLASQGPAFVGSWPYREILLRVFNDVDDKVSGKGEIDVEEMLGKVFDYVYHNSTDYLLAGYSFDLCLCSLSESKFTALTKSIKDLSEALVDGLKKENTPLINYCILLAHWKSQSYWNENYTDLCDFCFCLSNYCTDFIKAVTDQESFRDIQSACNNVIKILMDLRHADNPIIRADFAGPDSQYSHGLSVFFPWARPTSDKAIMKKDKNEKTEYEQYMFNQTDWFSFLNQYWGPNEVNKPVKGSTMRDPHKDENTPKGVLALNPVAPPNEDELLDEDIASLMFNSEGPLNSKSALDTKVNPPDPTGDECTCGSIKNYLRDTRTRRERGKIANVKPTTPVNQTIF